jgi:hypothetical protein
VAAAAVTEITANRGRLAGGDCVLVVAPFLLAALPARIVLREGKDAIVPGAIVWAALPAARLAVSKRAAGTIHSAATSGSSGPSFGCTRKAGERDTFVRFDDPGRARVLTIHRVALDRSAS